MKKKVLIGLVIILFLVIIFGITYMLFLEKRNNGISLIKDNVVIEYGNTYNPNIEELVDLSKYKFINKQEISIEYNIENEKDKDYPAVGVYEINIIYKNIILKQKIEIKDTIAPNIEVLENIRIDYNTDLSSFDFKKYFNVTDLSPTKELVVNLSNINSSISGEQTTIASVEDIYSNKKEIELKINILEKAEETQKEKIEKQEQFTNNATSKNSGTIQGTKKNDVKNNKKTQNSSSNSSSNVQNSSTNNADSIPKKEEPIWCDEGGKKHWQGTGKNEHGYYKTWDAAWTECKNYMKDMKSGNYAVKECPCGLFYFWVEEN